MYLTSLSALLILIGISDGKCPKAGDLDKITDYIGLSKDPKEMQQVVREEGRKLNLRKKPPHWSDAADKKMQDLLKQKEAKTGPKRFLCARAYEAGHHVPHLACTGRTLDIPNGDVVEHIGYYGKYWDRWPFGEQYFYKLQWVFGWWHDEISALVVRPGCRFHAYEHHFWGGADHVFREGIHNNMGWWINRPSSWYCECDYTNEILHCDPREEDRNLTVCDSLNNMDGECQATLSEGTEWGQEVTHGNSVDETVSLELGGVLQEILTATIGHSQTMGEYWESTKIKMNHQERGKAVTCKFPANGTVTILQKVAICGNTTVHTGHYQCV